MSGLAKLCLNRGYQVRGSDRTRSNLTKRLEELGVNVFYSHSVSNLQGVDAVIYSSAISEDNDELACAKEMGLVIIKRSELLGELLKEYKRSVAIAGCHGKTTTTAMLGEIMACASQSPTVFLGGEYDKYDNLLIGNGDLAIAEACEYKRSFLDIYAKIAVVLNIDNDHLDCYSDMNDLVKSFKSFVGDRLAVLNADEPYINEISNCTSITFGINNVANYYAKDIKQTEKGISFTACAYAKPYGKINLAVSGVYNLYNALAAFATADLLGAPFASIKKGLERFNGVKRRNEYLGEKSGLKYYADYAHHPSEIKAVLNWFKTYGDDFITVFQPHTYSRTRLLKDDFIQAFKDLERVIIYKTYPAREKFDKKGSAKTLAKEIEKQVQHCFYAHDVSELTSQIKMLEMNNRRVLFLGAGDIYDIAKAILREKQKVQKLSEKI